MPSFVLIPPTVWAQCMNVTDRQDRQQTDSIGQTVLQTVKCGPLRLAKVIDKNKLPRFYGSLCTMEL